MFYKFANGSEFNGSVEDFKKVAAALGENVDFDNGDFYYSESKKQYMKISEMVPQHLRNAFLALLRKKLDTLQNETHLTKIKEAIIGIAADKVMISMLTAMEGKVIEMPLPKSTLAYPPGMLSR